MKYTMKKILRDAFILYVAVLLRILFLGRGAECSFSVREYFFLYANLCPFRTLVRYVSFFLLKRDRASFCLALINIGGNFLLFLPMGLFLPALFSRLRRFRKCVWTVFFLISFSEILQGVLRIGIPDVDDLLLNLLGACIGFCVAKNLGFCKEFLS